jgi:hypothetical protein
MYTASEWKYTDAHMGPLIRLQPLVYFYFLNPIAIGSKYGFSGGQILVA